MRDTQKKTHPKWRLFEEARTYVQTLGLKKTAEWRTWVKEGNKPVDIPSNPDKLYKSQGWTSWGDWLGTGAIASFNKSYRSFEEGRTFVRSLGLKNQKEWQNWAVSNTKPIDIPANPVSVYQERGWVNWGDWLGTSSIASKDRIYQSFEEARAFVHTFGLKNKDEWQTWVKSNAKPDDIPTNPRRVYKDQGWVGWGDWLGTGNVASKNRIYQPFEKARSFVHNLRLKSKNEWQDWIKSAAKPDDIPTNPHRVYKDKGWIGLGDWLGTGNVASFNRTYLPFEEARTFARSLGLKSNVEWKAWAKSSDKPDNIPASPSMFYQNQGWVGWGDWLGTGTIASQNRICLPFEEARAYVRSLGLKSQAEWTAWAKSDDKPDNIPAQPYQTYKNKGWVSMGDWLGTGTIATFNRTYRPFEEARTFVRSLGLKSQAEWTAWAKSDDKPDDVPADPPETYKGKGWVGMGDWLGVFNQWNRNAVLSFLRSIEPVLPQLQPAELYAIMRQNGMIASSVKSNNSNAPLIKSIRDLCSSPNPESDFEKIVAEIEEQNATLDNDELSDNEEIAPDVVPAEEETTDELPTLRSFAALKAVDLLVDAGITSDEETLEFLVCNRVSELWQACLNNDPKFDLARLRTETGGAYFNEIRNR